MSPWVEGVLVDRLRDAFEDAGLYSPSRDMVEAVYFDAVEPIAMELEKARSALLKIAEWDGKSTLGYEGPRDVARAALGMEEA